MRPLTGRLALLRSLALAPLLGACASAPYTQASVDPFRVEGAVSEDVMLTVENNDFRDATIHAIWNGLRRRVGTVTGKTSATFRMDWRSEEVQLAIDYLGGGGYVSERVPVTQGDHLNFVIMGQ